MLVATQFVGDKRYTQNGRTRPEVSKNPGATINIGEAVGSEVAAIAPFPTCRSLASRETGAGAEFCRRRSYEEGLRF